MNSMWQMKFLRKLPRIIISTVRLKPRCMTQLQRLGVHTVSLLLVAWTHTTLVYIPSYDSRPEPELSRSCGCGLWLILRRFLFIYLPLPILSAKLSVTDVGCMLHSKSSYMHARPACHYPLLVGYIIKLPIQFLLFPPSSSPAKVIGIDPDTRGPRSTFFLPTLQKVPVQQHSRRKPVFYRFFHSSGTVVFWGNHVSYVTLLARFVALSYYA